MSHVGLDAADLEGRPPALRLAVPAVDGLQLLPIPRHCAGSVRLCVSYAGWVYACGSANLQDTTPGIDLMSTSKHIRSLQAWDAVRSKWEVLPSEGRRSRRANGERNGAYVCHDQQCGHID